MEKIEFTATVTMQAMETFWAESIEEAREHFDKLLVPGAAHVNQQPHQWNYLEDSFDVSEV